MTDLDRASFDRILDIPAGSPDWDDVLHRSRVRRGSRGRRVAVLAAAALVVVIGAASASGTVRGFILGTTEGSRIAFASIRNGSYDLYVMNADGSKQQRLTPTAGDVGPVWSPDGRKIAYGNTNILGDDDIYVANSDGSARRRLTRDAAIDRKPCWSPDGRKIAYERLGLPQEAGAPWVSDVYVIDADGSGERNLTGDAASSGPVCSPDGRRIAFLSRRDASQEPWGGAYVMNADGSDQRMLTRNAGDAGDIPVAWSPDGRKILLVRGVGLGFAGALRAYVYVVNADGSGLRRLTRTTQVNGSDPVWSPDGRKIAFVSDRDGNVEVYAMNPDGSGKRNLTRHPGFDSAPAWSPDGRKIVFSTKRDGNFEVYVMNADGSGQRNLTRNPALDRFPVWSPGRKKEN